MFRLLPAVCVVVLTAALLSACSSDDSTPPTTPPVTKVKSFQSDIKPIFQTHGCLGCHGTQANLSLATVPSILTGGVHGPAVVAGNADSSLIIKKLSPTPPFGNRMPGGGTPLNDATIQIIKDWINEGAKDN